MYDIGLTCQRHLETISIERMKDTIISKVSCLAQKIDPIASDVFLTRRDPSLVLFKKDLHMELIKIKILSIIDV